MSPGKEARVFLIVLGILGLLLAAGATAVFYFYSHIVRSIINAKLVLQESSSFFDSWVSSSYPSYTKFYFFDVINHESITNGSKQMKLKEVGPYTFRKYNKKKIIDWNDEDGTVTYREQSSYLFLPEMSRGSLQDVVNIINLPLLGIVKQTELKSPKIFKDIAFSIVDDTLNEHGEKLFIHRTIDELLFKGYKVPAVGELLDLARSLLNDVEIPDVLPNNTFGLFYGKNNTDSEEVSIYTGSKSMDQYMLVNRWNNMSALPYWNDSFCDMINGTDGYRFPPPVRKTDKLYVFVKDICRSVYFVFERRLLVNDLPILRFVVTPRLFSSANNNPDNRCFCKELKSCDVGGITPVGPCYMDVPVVASAPHFYLGDERLLKNVDGITPNKRDHQSFVNVEPVTGTVVKGARRIQINADLRREKYISAMKTINEDGVILPVFWISEISEIDDYGVEYLYSATRYPLGKLITLGIITVSGTSIIISVIGYYCLKRQKVKLPITGTTLQMTEIKKEGGQ